MALTKIVADRVAIHWAYVGGERLPSEATNEKKIHVSMVREWCLGAQTRIAKLGMCHLNIS